MSKRIALTQYAQDGSVVHVIVSTDEMTQAIGDDGKPVFEQTGTETKQRPTGEVRVITEATDAFPATTEPIMEEFEEPILAPVMVPVTVTHTFGGMPEFTDASIKTRFKVEDYVAQCEREVQALIDAESAKPELIEVSHAG